MPYKCPFCSDVIGFSSGYDLSGPDYGGNSKEVDHYRCPDCQREFCHVVIERFGGFIDTWQVRTGTGWADLTRLRWPGSTSEEKQRPLTETHVSAQKGKERERRLGDIRQAFATMLSSPDNQYRLADVLKHVFALFDLSYEIVSRTDTQGALHFDGAFQFEGIDYSVEAPWRKAPPTMGDLLAFTTRINRMAGNVRGLYASGVALLPNTLEQFQRVGPTSIMLMDAHDLVLILEGRVALNVGLNVKANKAFQEGVPFYSLANIAGQ